ncbi:MAG: zinc dependent phospholipase C family protein [Deltaproteobacteria bacterium]|nr:zinc dependent phospholipase C family protein [Deltaproteobacteria bacterium]
MADTLLHITLARQIAQHPLLHGDVGRWLTRHSDDYLLGSAAFDLPYYENLLFNGILTLRGRSVPYHPFGQCIHEHACRDTCIALLDAATERPALAFALGALTHFAVDIVFHREIEQRIRHSSLCHDTLERRIGLLCHYRLLGHACVGTATAHESTFLFPHFDWAAFFRSTLARFYPNTPDTFELTGWQRGLRSFGYLYSKPWFPWLNTAVQPDEELESLAVGLMNDATDKAVTYLNGAHAVKTGQMSRTQLENIIPALRMSDGLPER